MLAARGVSLGLGKINLSDLNSLPRGSRQAAKARQRRERNAAMENDDKPKLVVKKRVDKQTAAAVDAAHKAKRAATCVDASSVCLPSFFERHIPLMAIAPQPPPPPPSIYPPSSLTARAPLPVNRQDLLLHAKRESKFLLTYYERNKKTLWAACRAVVFGTILIVLGIVMAVIGYFDEALSTEKYFNVTTQTEHKIINAAKRFQFKSLQYIGPIVMGIGSFILMIACVMTLESRDKHAQVVHEQAIVTRRSTKKKTNPASQFDANVVTTDDEQRPLTSAERLPPRSPPDGRPDHTILPPPSSERNNNFVHQHSNSARRAGVGAANASISHRGPDAALYSNAMGLPMMAKKEGHMEKFASTSCIDDLSKRADTRALLQRFLDDQSRMADEMERLTKSGLHNQSYSLHMRGSEDVAAPTSDDTQQSRHTTIAEVHQPPSLVLSCDSGNPATSSTHTSHSRTIVPPPPPPSAVIVKRAHRRGYRSPGRAPIAAPDSLLDVANDSDSLEQFVSPMSTSPETTAAAATRLERIPRRANQSSTTSYATAFSGTDGDENANNRANATFTPIIRLTGRDNGQKRVQDTAVNHISHFDDAHPFS
uniref:Uncharacterized protein n=1 Tax=Plectus sambesii TaxID=2011161 RepID=A0A914WU25_9BILA